MSGEKTEQPTDKKLEDAREKGQVAQSKMVSKLLVCASVFELVFAMKDKWLEALKALVLLPTTRVTVPFDTAYPEVITGLIGTVFILSLVPLALSAILACAGTWIQVGFLIAPKVFEGAMDKINPINAAKGMFKIDKIMEIVLGVIKIVLIAVIFYIVVKGSLGVILLLSTGSLDLLIESYIALMKETERSVIVIVLVLAGVDYAVQKHKHIKGLMMSHDDIKQEHKESEGDPQIKGQRQALMRKLAREPMKKTKTADALVVNPTHFAVALKYRYGETPLPIVLAKGRDHIAKSMIMTAYEYNVPVIRYVSLARTLYDKGVEDERIPRETLKPTAFVFRLVEELRNAEAYGEGDIYEVDEYRIRDLMSG